MKKELRCTDCKKVILGAFKVYEGDLCKDCYYKPVHPELNRHKLLSNNKQDFYKDRLAWNEKSIAEHKQLVSRYIDKPMAVHNELDDPLLHKKVQVPVIKVHPHEWA